MRRAGRAAILAAAGAAAVAAASLHVPYPESRLRPGETVSLRITDRRGEELRHVLSGAGGRSVWVTLDEISPHAVWATLAAEDRHFFLHRGLHWPSIGRAVVRNVRAGVVVSGASTLTQQLVRNLEPGPRTLGRKLREAWLAVRLESGASKTAILTQYLNRVPYGNLAHGIEAAARLYLDKPAALLSPAEAAFLAALPRAPSAANPYRGAAGVETRRRAILKAMTAMGRLSAAELERALAERIALRPPGGRFEAPHFVDLVRGRLGPDGPAGATEVRTTLDLSLQKKMEALLAARVDALADRDLGNGAAVVMDNANGDVLALVGSRDYFDEARGGMVNGAASPRQPGSALKPFVYALALEKGATAATILADEPEEYPAPGGTFAPRNYDREHHGPVRLRTALACSYNVPAVAAAAAIGTGPVHRRLLDLGFAGLDRPAEHYGLGLSLGNGEVTLLELVRAYAALARGGLWKPERLIMEMTGPDGRPAADRSAAADVRVFDAAAAFIITHILADPAARVPAFGDGAPLRLPFLCAVKTGTTKDYRDNWTVGCTSDYTVGVWVGNFDGRPMHGVSGITGCGPLFRDIMLALHTAVPPRPFAEPAGLVRTAVCPTSGQRVRPGCPGAIEEIFIAGTEPGETCPLDHDAAAPSRPRPAIGVHPSAVAAESPGRLRIVNPLDGTVFRLDPVLRAEYQAIRLRAEAPAGVRQIEWRVDGRAIGRTAAGDSFLWRLRPGSFTMTAAAAAGATVADSRPVRITVLR